MGPKCHHMTLERKKEIIQITQIHIGKGDMKAEEERNGLKPRNVDSCRKLEEARDKFFLQSPIDMQLC